MKKIAILHYAYYPNVGGVERVIEDQATVLAELGFDVSIITGFGQSNNTSFKIVVEEKFQSLSKINPSLQKKIFEQGVQDDEFRKLSDEIFTILESVLKEFQVIIVHNMLTLNLNLPFTQAFHKYANNNPQKKIIIWVHDHKGIDEEKIIVNDLHFPQWHMQLLTKLVTNAQYVAISDTFGNLLSTIMQFKKNQLSIIYNGINTEKLLKLSGSTLEVIERIEAYKSFPLILVPINIIPRKNLEYTIEVIYCLKQYYPSIKLVVTGSTSGHKLTEDYYLSIKNKANSLSLDKHVIFLKDFGLPITTFDIRDLYMISDAIFYFSKGENFGLPILEASLFKLPLFVSDLKVFHEIGRDNLTYIDFRSINPEQAAQKINEIIGENCTLLLSNEVKREFNMKKIVSEQLVPLFS